MRNQKSLHARKHVRVSKSGNDTRGIKVVVGCRSYYATITRTLVVEIAPHPAHKSQLVETKSAISNYNIITSNIIMYQRETFHSSSSSLNFDFDRDDNLVIREYARPSLSRSGSRSSSSRGLLGSARNLMARGRSNPSLRDEMHSNGSMDSLTGRRPGKILSRSSGSLRSLKNAEFGSMDGTTTKNRPLDRRALLLGTKGSGAGSSSNRNLSNLGGLLKLSSSRGDLGDRGTPNRNNKSKLSSRRTLEISHEETLAILLAHEFENFDM